MPDYGGYRPHYQGSGITTPGGRGGTLWRVNTLADDGLFVINADGSRSGSLRAAIEASGARCVVFEISGRIEAQSELLVSNGNLTIAGQTAPAPGITVSHSRLRVTASNAVFQHFRWRLGDALFASPAASNGVNLHQVSGGALSGSFAVFDHMSFSWAPATQMACFGPSVLIVDCLIGEGLDRGLSVADNSGVGIFIDYGPPPLGFTFARNLMVHCSHRNPYVGPGAQYSGYNNLVYGGYYEDTNDGNGNFLSLLASDPASPNNAIEAAWVNNHTIAPAYPTTSVPNTKAVAVWFDQAHLDAGDSYLYMSGNIGPFQTLGDQWSGVQYYGVATEANTRVNTVPAYFSAFNFDTVPASSVRTAVCNKAGARPAERLNASTRDADDYRLTEHARNGTYNSTASGRIFSQTDVGGYPSIPVNTRAYVDPPDPNSVATGETFRTNREVTLENSARAVENLGIQARPPMRIVADLRRAFVQYG